MQLKGMWNRRSFLATVGSVAASLLAPARLFGRKLAAKSDTSTITGFGQTGNVYEDLFGPPPGGRKGRQRLRGPRRPPGHQLPGPDDPAGWFPSASGTGSGDDTGGT